MCVERLFSKAIPSIMTGDPITRTEALQTSRQILLCAERERFDVDEKNNLKRCKMAKSKAEQFLGLVAKLDREKQLAFDRRERMLLDVCRKEMLWSAELEGFIMNDKFYDVMELDKIRTSIRSRRNENND